MNRIWWPCCVVMESRRIMGTDFEPEAFKGERSSWPGHRPCHSGAAHAGNTRR
jgi:hypothetical protein